VKCKYGITIDKILKICIPDRQNFMEDMIFYYPEGHTAHFERGHPERPERVETIRSTLMASSLWDTYPKLPPIGLSDDFIQTVHSPAYLTVLELTCRRGGHLDPDTYTTKATWELAHRVAGGAAAVASAVWEGLSQRGFALTRPPGHHAMRGQGMGFCLLNNIAIAAEYLIKNYHVDRLAIVDLDLHHGNGTQDIFWDRDDVFYVSTHQSPFYPGTGGIGEIGTGQGEGWTANFPLPPGSGDVAFLTIMDEMILPLLDKKDPQMILVSYGFDPHWLDPFGHLLLTSDGYAKLIKRLCGWTDSHCAGRIALFLEGGYDLKAAGACSMAVISAMLEKGWDDPYPCPYQENNAWRVTLNQAHSIWKV
jgi:acetoin utilization deacetylase AcuC-like enzyme